MSLNLASSYLHLGHVSVKSMEAAFPGLAMIATSCLQTRAASYEHEREHPTRRCS